MWLHWEPTARASIVWLRIPYRAIVSDTSNMPQHDTVDDSGLCIAVPECLRKGATVNIMDSRTMLRVDIGFYIGIVMVPNRVLL